MNVNNSDSSEQDPPEEENEEQPKPLLILTPDFNLNAKNVCDINNPNC